MFSLKLLGGVSLEGDGGPLTGPAAQRHRLALLALLGTSRPRSWTRDKLMAWLWPERDTERARGLLNQAVHVLRRSLGEEAIRSAGDELQLDPAVVSCDVTSFEEALSAGALERAAALYGGPLLDGFFLGDAEEFERWVARERQRLATAYSGLLESLADQSESQADWRRSVDWWSLRVAQDPYDSRAVVRLMLALEASGNRAAATLQAAAHQRLLQDELGLEPSPEVRAVAERLRSAPTAQPAWLPATPFSPSQPPEPLVPPAGPSSAEGAAPRPRRSRLVPYGIVAILAVGVIATAMLLRSRPAGAPAVPDRPAAPTVDEIAQAVAREIARRERGDTAARLAPQRTRSIAAYELYLRGTDPVLLRSDSAAQLAVGYLRRALALDSGYAAAWAGLARLTVRANADGGDAASRAEVKRTAEAAARKAIALDDSLPVAHATLGIIRMRQNDLAGAEAALRHSLALDPGVAQHREWLVKLLIWTGRPAEALAEARRAQQLTPLSPTSTAELARALLANGRCDEALAELQKLAGLEPPLGRVPGIMAQCYLQKRWWREAVAVMPSPAKRQASGASGLSGYALAAAGRREEASRMLASLQARERQGELVSLEIALLYLGLGDLDRAVPWLDRAAEDGSLSGLSEAAPLAARILDSLRAYPRIASLRRRLGLQNR